MIIIPINLSEKPKCPSCGKDENIIEVCKHCGHEHEDDGLYYDEHESNCDACKKLFFFTFRHVSFFTTKKKLE